MAYSSPRERMLTEEEVLLFFEHVHHNRSLPPCLEYRVIPVDPHGSKITPPMLNFQDGLFLLCDTDSHHFPQHLLERISREPIATSSFHWHPAKKDAASQVQMRNCYRYNRGNVGGPPAFIWTKIDKDGREDLHYRLMHVLPSKNASAPQQTKKVAAPQQAKQLTQEMVERNRLEAIEKKARRMERKRRLEQEIRNIAQHSAQPTPNELQPGDVISSLRPQDVASTRDRRWHTRPSNELFRSLVKNAAQSVDTGDSEAVRRVSERIVNVIMVDRKGMFVRDIRDGDENDIWKVMSHRESIQKTSQAIRNWKTKEANGGWYTSKASIAKKEKEKKNGAIKKKPPRKKKKIVYQAQAGLETSIHPYALLLISAACNQPEEALRVLQSPLHGLFEEGRTESCAERAMRLQLRHRFAGALSTGLTPRSFSKRLLQIWGGSLVQAQEGSNVLNAVESQILSGPDLAMTRSEKQADQDASEDGHHESSDEDQPRGIEGKQTPTDAEEESDG